MVMDVLKSPNCMPNGGMLGFYCQHGYAHTSLLNSHRLPYGLKGMDAIFYSIFFHVGLDVKVRPVMNDVPDDEFIEHLSDKEDHDALKFYQNANACGTEFHRITFSNAGDGPEDYEPVTEVCNMSMSLMIAGH